MSIHWEEEERREWTRELHETRNVIMEEVLGAHLRLGSVQGNVLDPELCKHKAEELALAASRHKDHCGAHSPPLFHVVQQVRQIHLLHLLRYEDVLLPQLLTLQLDSRRRQCAISGGVAPENSSTV